MKILIGKYHHTEADCPGCGGNYGMFEKTDNPDILKYTCWCGMTCKATLEEDDEIE